MTFPDDATLDHGAVPTNADPFAPDNPAALGYDLSDPGFATVRRAVAADRDLACTVQGQLRRETARFRAWAESYRRAGRGGCGLGGGPEPFRPTPPEVILDRARETLRRRSAWRTSPRGRQASALTETEAAAAAVGDALAEARAALDRADGSLPRRAEAAVGLAGRLSRCAEALRQAATASDAGTEQREALWRLTREVCAPPVEASTSAAALREG